MDSPDPHIHVDAGLHADVRKRSMLASTFGLAADLPSHATTGCQLRVPYAMTSTAPTKVTCLACRDYAHRRYLELAEFVSKVDVTPGMGFELVGQAVRAAEQYRELARQFRSDAQ
ncbi:hypothetical protein JIG36_45490 [Actinoplanes sp. LDG1-06]|uniref:Uncharacterized protein n=1 Tax=Paractinoplanes ovalisporus TaxID=2810368 RepID=A0ABS2ATR2_9ACTN|nr:hypothetical protein [Actinoplanes ovalisporus]MBM2622778.1 hypothetical protein [Actinoplanes ovalisporus]